MNKPTKNFLSTKEKSELYILQRSLRDKRKCDRIRVILLLNQGWSYEKIATAFFLDETTIRRYFKSYCEEGADALLTLHYQGGSSELTASQLDQLSQYVEESNPSSASLVVDYIKRTFDKEYSLSAATAILKKLGFVYKKSTLTPGKSDPIKQEQFLRELDKLESELEEKDPIFYMDGVHPQHNSKPSYAWFKAGSPAVLKSNTGRQRVNINGALNAKSLDVIVREDLTINAQSTIALFEQIEKAHPDANRIVVICDNAKYYRSKLVSDYLKTSKVEIKFLPPYSPNLNLIER